MHGQLSSRGFALVGHFGGLRIRRRPRRAFTLIELLVVVAIISLLLALLLPSLERAKALARRAVCASNMRNLGVAAATYASNENFWYPPLGSGGLTFNNVSNAGWAQFPYGAYEDSSLGWLGGWVNLGLLYASGMEGTYNPEDEDGDVPRTLTGYVGGGGLYFCPSETRSEYRVEHYEPWPYYDQKWGVDVIQTSYSYNLRAADPDGDRWAQVRKYPRMNTIPSGEVFLADRFYTRDTAHLDAQLDPEGFNTMRADGSVRFVNADDDFIEEIDNYQDIDDKQTDGAAQIDVLLDMLMEP